MDVMVRFGFTVTRGMYGIRPRSVVGAGAGVCPLAAVEILGFRLTLVLAENYTIRIERISAFIAPMIWVAAVKTESLV